MKYACMSLVQHLNFIYVIRMKKFICNTYIFRKCMKYICNIYEIHIYGTYVFYM